MQRRDLLILTTMATTLGNSTAFSQTEKIPSARLIHIFATPDGESHFGDVIIANNAGDIPVTSMSAGAYARSPNTPAEWHLAPRLQFAINMTGTLEVEVSDGTRRKIGQGDLVFLEDIAGKGHVTRALEAVSNIFIHVPQNWNMLDWARGTSDA